MGTRGIVGFRLDGEDRLAYNHFDSYPSGLGIEVVQQIDKMATMHFLDDTVRDITLVTDETPITQKVIDRCTEITNLGVSRQSTYDWYCLLREAQGNLLAYLELGLMLDSNSFIKDSLFCEWGYIVNLDTAKLEVWRGFQKAPDPTNRYGQEAHDSHSSYYPCKMIAEFDLATVTEQDVVALDDYD